MDDNKEKDEVMGKVGQMALDAPRMGDCDEAGCAVNIILAAQLGAAKGYEAGQPKWTPVRSEADLPIEDGYYLATVGAVGIDPDETTCHELNWFKGKWYLPSDEMIEMGPVIAWMPLPTPFTASKEDENERD